MQNNFPKVPLIVSSIFFCVSLSLLIFFSLALVKNSGEAEKKEREWRKETERRDEIRALDSTLQALAGERASLETHFAKSSDVVPFLNTLESLASRAGAKAAVNSVSILSDHTGLLVGISASGSFTSLYKFLKLLENSPYELEFISMNLKKEVSPGQGAASWTAAFSLKLLSFIE